MLSLNEILTLIILFQMGCIIYTDKGFVSTALYCEEKASTLNKALNNGYFSRTTYPSASKSDTGINLFYYDLYRVYYL